MQLVDSGSRRVNFALILVGFENLDDAKLPLFMQIQSREGDGEVAKALE